MIEICGYYHGASEPNHKHRIEDKNFTHQQKAIIWKMSGMFMACFHLHEGGGFRFSKDFSLFKVSSVIYQFIIKQSKHSRQAVL